MKRKILGLTLLLMNTSIEASSHEFSIFNQCFYPLIGLSVGGASPITKGPSNDFAIIDPVADEFFHYHGHRRTETQALLNATLGVETILKPNLLLQAGFSYYSTSRYRIKGNFIQGADIFSSNLFNYAYHLKNYQLMAEAKLLTIYRVIYHPFVLAGFGISHNKASNYTTNVPAFLTFTREYENHQRTAFAYDVGIGLDVDLNSCYRVGIGYKLMNIGKHELGNATIDGIPVGGTLSRSSFWVNELWLQGTIFV